jgi:DNA mismatch endonuclease (patch repair protein)
MTDDLSRFHGLTRSQLMSRIRSRGNKKTEIALIRLLRARRITGWRRHQPLPGRPDFLFRREHVAVFVDGCFWHGCPVCYRRPSSNQAFWDQKLKTNRARDRRVTSELRATGWTVLRIWEHQLTKGGDACIRRLLSALNPTHKGKAT